VEQVEQVEQVKQVKQEHFKSFDKLKSQRNSCYLDQYKLMVDVIHQYVLSSLNP
jgi:hypothetical protein